MQISSDLLPWLLYGTPFAIVLLLYVRKHHSLSRGHQEQLRESIAQGLTEPPSLHPVVDLTRCIGSAACVKSCPESALGVINGKAVLVGASQCIGHGACFSACPVEAIQLVFGTQRRGIDLPLVRPNFESNVRGIFIAGELGGMGLIRKATEQGRQALESARASMSGAAPYDVIIVGAGPAGLAAGLGAIEQRLQYKLLEQEDSLGGAVFHYPRKKVVMTAPVKLPIIGKVKMSQIGKEQLLDFWNGVVAKTGLQIAFRERMESIGKSGDGFVVQTSRGSYRTKTVLLAIGRRGTPRKLNVPGEESAKVVYRLIDPEQYQGRRVLIVGGGDSALEAALAIAQQPGARATLSYRGEAFNRVKEKNRTQLEQARAAGELKVLQPSSVERIEADRVHLVYQGKPVVIRNDDVVVCAGGELPTELLKKVGVLFQTHRGAT